MPVDGLSSPLAVVGDDHQLHVVGPAPQGARPVTFSGASGRLWGAAVRDGSTWPVWSPDRSWLGCFQAPAGADPNSTQVAASQVDGPEERLLLQLPETLPVHMQFSPDGARLAVLVQAGEVLQLWVCSLAGGAPRLIEEGAPLFFSWLPDGLRLVVHAGGAGGVGRVSVRTATGRGEDEPLTEAAGLFTTPHVAAGRLVWSQATADGAALACRSLEGGATRFLVHSRRVLGFLPDPTGRWLAMSRARSDGRVYDGLELLHIESGVHRVLATGAVTAFCWSPDAQAVLLCRPLPARGALRWSVLPAGAPPEAERVLAAFRPTRDQLFQLRFFEQFMPTHPPVSPDGAVLVWAGAAVDALGCAEGAHRIWSAPVQGVGAVRGLSGGSYAVFPQARGGEPGEGSAGDFVRPVV